MPYVAPIRSPREQELYDCFWQLNGEIFGTPEEEKRERELLLQEIETQPAMEVDPAWLCLKGYVLYCLHRRAEAQHCFESALAIDPDDGWAMMYVAHCLDDGGDHQAALPLFIAANEASLNPMLVRKKDEMILCCRVRLEGVEGYRQEIQKHLEQCAAADDFPFNLSRVLKSRHASIAQWDVVTDEEAVLFNVMMRRAHDELEKDPAVQREIYCCGIE